MPHMSARTFWPATKCDCGLLLLELGSTLGTPSLLSSFFPVFFVVACRIISSFLQIVMRYLVSSFVQWQLFFSIIQPLQYTRTYSILQRIAMIASIYTQHRFSKARATACMQRGSDRKYRKSCGKKSWFFEAYHTLAKFANFHEVFQKTPLRPGVFSGEVFWLFGGSCLATFTVSSRF